MLLIKLTDWVVASKIEFELSRNSLLIKGLRLNWQFMVSSNNTLMEIAPVTPAFLRI
jgi:hypothetical protein